MDPNATLNRILQLAPRVREEAEGSVLDPDTAAELAELIEDLHDWLDRGGALPTSWGG